MIKDIRVQKILDENSAYAVNYHNFDLGKAFLIHFSEWEFLPENCTWRYVCSLYFHRCNVHELKKAFEKFQHVFSINVNRKDHQQNMELIAGDVPESILINLAKSSYHFWLLSPWRFCFTLFHTLRKTGFRKGVRGLFFFAAVYYHYVTLINDLERYFGKMDLRWSSYMPINSSTYEETILTEYFKRSGCKTFHYCHGQHFVSYKIAPYFDFVNAANIVADKIILWGRASFEDIKTNFPEYLKTKEIYIGGNPRMKKKSISAKQTFRRGIIFLGAFEHYRENLTLLETMADVMRERKICFDVKPHPSIPPHEIQVLCEKYGMKLYDKSLTISAILGSQNYDFAVVNQSNIYYEALYENLVSFRYALHENPQIKGLNDKFVSKNEFLERLDYFSAMPREVLNSEVEQLLVDCMGMGVNSYREIFTGKSLPL